MNDTKEIKELVERCHKMSYWLGFTYSAMIAMLNDNTLANCQKETISCLVDMMAPAMNDIFYTKQE